MSQDIIDRLVAELLSNEKVDLSRGKGLYYEFAVIARQYTDNSGTHFFKVTPENIQRIVIAGIARLELKLSKGMGNTKQISTFEDAESIALSYFSNDENFFTEVFTDFKTEASTLHNDSVKIVGDSLEIVESSRSGGDWVKNLIFKIVEKKISSKKEKFSEHLQGLLFEEKEIITAKGKSQKKTGIKFIYDETQFHHIGTTVGLGQAAMLASGLKDKQVTRFSSKEIQFTFSKNPKGNYFSKSRFWNKDSREAAANLLTESIVAVVTENPMQWVMDDSNTKRVLKIKSIEGEFGSRQYNNPGDQNYDWKNLKKDIFKVFSEKLKESAETDENLKKLATRKGSQPFIERLGASIVNNALNDIVKTIKVKKAKQDKPKNYGPKKKKLKSSRKRKVQPYIPKGGKAKISTAPTKTSKKAVQPPTLNLNALKAQINARLSMTVIKNMGTPALENRTGRFARSVQVTDVIQTSKGFPSVGYTYQKYPYQTFEPGFKQGSVQRDPRTLIDKSIREIASELMVGRFYTRRV